MSQSENLRSGTDQANLTETTSIIAPGFSIEQKEALADNRAFIHQFEGLSINAMIAQGRRFTTIINSSERMVPSLADTKSRLIEVAVFPDPEWFVVPDSTWLDEEDQARKLLEDADKLQEWLGLEGITEILLEAPELLEVWFAHLDQRNQDLISGEVIEHNRYQSGKHPVFLQTATPIYKGPNYDGSKEVKKTAVVGAGPKGPNVIGWYPPQGLGVPRVVVPLSR